MKEERATKNNRGHSANASRGGSASSSRYFNSLDLNHSVFARESYYDDLIDKHPWLRRPCSRHSGISSPAISGTPCSARHDELARPRIRREHHIRQEFFDNITNYAYSGVPPGALAARCSEHLEELAQPRRTSSVHHKDNDKATKQSSEHTTHAQPKGTSTRNKDGGKAPKHASENTAQSQQKGTAARNKDDNKAPKNISAIAAHAQPANSANASAKPKRK